MSEQAQLYGTRIETGQVTRLDRDEDGGCSSPNGVRPGRGADRAARDRSQQPPPADGRGAARRGAGRGLIRYCPICDGYEVTDKKVGVIGSGEHGVAEAVFLRGYTADMTLIAPDKAHELTREGPRRARGGRHRAGRRAAEAVAMAEAASSSTPPKRP